MAHARLVRAGIADGDLLPFQDVGAAGLVEANGVGHGFILVIGNTSDGNYSAGGGISTISMYRTGR
jgi:hypothetical protein